MLEKRSTPLNSEPDMSDVLEGIRKKGRDNARTPMQVHIINGWKSFNYPITNSSVVSYETCRLHNGKREYRTLDSR